VTRTAVLYARIAVVQRTFGLGPMTDALGGRLRAAMHLDPPAAPWYAMPGDYTDAMVAYQRESGKHGFHNRTMRKRFHLPRLSEP
jgi:hypothetical protein